jgi:hypothetical protein
LKELGKKFERPSLETPFTKKKKKNRAGGVAKSIGPEFKPEYHKKKKSHIYSTLTSVRMFS